MTYNIDLNNVPTHIGIIMDGNGRWAKSRFLPRTAGHKAGVETIRKIIKESQRLGIKHVTLYAFSTENWKRPKEEVDYLFNAAYDFLEKYQPTIFERQTRVFVSGDIEPLPDKLKNKIKELIEKTGLSNYTLTKLNKGETVTTETLLKICKVLNCTFDDIMEITEE